jgi:GTPase SAR1 family protein
MELNVWDAGGQERYMERYFSESQRELIFSEITTAVFMVDSAAPDSNTREIFDKFYSYVFEFSPHVDKVYVLLNKIDLPDSREDDFFELLTNGIEKDIKEKIVFTPVSVKEGSAQHRLIEILDYEIQKSTLAMQRLGKIRHLLTDLKADSLSEYMLFNLPDGLLVASTFGKFESKPLQFIKFEMGTLESNLYQIYSKIMLLLNQNASPISLSTIVYESDECYVLIKELADAAVIMAVTKNKKPEVFGSVMNTLSGELIKELEEIVSSAI